MQIESQYRWKTAKILPSSKSAAPSISNQKRFTLSGISSGLKIVKKNTETHVQQKQSYTNITIITVNQEHEAVN